MDGGSPGARGGREEVKDALIEAYYAIPGSSKLDELVVGGGEREGNKEEREERPAHGGAVQTSWEAVEVDHVSCIATATLPLPVLLLRPCRPQISHALCR